MRPPQPRRCPTASRARVWLAAWSLALLSACGGGGGDRVSPPFGCDLADQQSWLRSYMNDWYFWYRLSPSPDPAGFASLASYFDALLYTGTDAAFPADRFSYYESTDSYNRFFGDGKSLGYGLFVAGVEVQGQPDLPLRVRYVEPQSDAAAKGVLRGEQIVSLNGRPASELIAADDYNVLVPGAAGDELKLVVRGGGGDRSVTLLATVYALTPVTAPTIVSSPLGRKIGYVLVKDMINQALTPLDDAFAQFKAQGVDEAVLDLRYNGGGLVSVGQRLASFVNAPRTNGRDYVRLLYNDKRTASDNTTVRFDNPAAALGLSRVYVLTGPRTCSASEQVINGLRPFVDVVTVGDTTCGKPVGFLPTAQCGNTFSVVNFESVNARNEGRYFDGLDANCPVAEDLSRPLGTPAEPLLAVAARHADTGLCKVIEPLEAPRKRQPGHRGTESNDRQGMFAQ